MFLSCRGVDSSCARHLTVESHTAVMTLTFILILLVFYYPLTLVPDLNLLLFCKSYTPQPSFSSSRLTPWIPGTVYWHFWAYPFLLFSFFCFPFLVLGSKWWIKLTHVSFWQARPFNSPLSGTNRTNRYQKSKTNLDFTEARDRSGSGIHWAICKSAPCSRQITMPAPHHSVFLQAGCPSCRPTNSIKALKAAFERKLK